MQRGERAALPEPGFLLGREALQHFLPWPAGESSAALREVCAPALAARRPYAKDRWTPSRTAHDNAGHTASLSRGSHALARYSRPSRFQPQNRRAAGPGAPPCEARQCQARRNFRPARRAPIRSASWRCGRPKAIRSAANASREQFEAAVAGFENARWIDINRGSDHEIIHHLTEAARHYDLTIVGQEDEDAPRIVPRELIEELIVESGRPVLVVPYAGHFSDVGARPLVAWTEARAAARALNDGLVLVQPMRKSPSCRWEREPNRRSFPLSASASI